MVKNSEAAKVMIIRMHSMKKNRREKKDWFRYHRNEKNWFAQKLRRFMHQCAFVLATPQYQITVIRLNILQSSLTQKLSVETRTNEGSTHHCLLNLFKRNIWLLFDFLFNIEENSMIFFYFAVFWNDDCLFFLATCGSELIISTWFDCQCDVWESLIS